MLGQATVIACGVLVYTMSIIPTYAVILITLFLLAVTYKKNRVIMRTLRRDVSCYLATRKLGQRMAAFRKDKKLLRDLLYEVVQKGGDKTAFIDADNDARKLTFNDVQDMSHRLANLFLARGYQKGDVVALFMENRVEYMPVWLGLSMIGVVVSLVNYNIRGDSLKHCFNVGNCKAVIFTESLIEAVKEIQDDLSTDFFYFDDPTSKHLSPSWERLHELLNSTSPDAPPRLPNVLPTDTLLYMYTSGTTGMPKAVIWSAMKNVSTRLWAFPLLNSNVFSIPP